MVAHARPDRLGRARASLAAARVRSGVGHGHGHRGDDDEADGQQDELIGGHLLPSAAIGTPSALAEWYCPVPAIRGQA